FALGPDPAGLWRDGADQRNLELKRRAANAFVERRLDGKPHAAIEKRSRQAAVHRTRWIEVSACRINNDGDTTAFGLHHVITHSLCERVEGQLSIGKTFDELQPAHRLP